MDDSGCFCFAESFIQKAEIKRKFLLKKLVKYLTIFFSVSSSEQSILGVTKILPCAMK